MPRPHRIAAALLACVPFAACQHVELASRSWREVKSDHFVLRTDLPEEEARHEAARVEEIRQALLDAFSWGSADPSRLRTFQLVLLDRRLEMEDIAGQEIAGFASTSPLGGDQVVAAAGEKHSQEILTHELAHNLVNGLLRNREPWFTEGLATFVETIYAEKGEVMLGALNGLRANYFRHNLRARSKALLSLHDEGGLASMDGYGFETRCYALFFTLFNRHPAQLAAYMLALTRGDAREGLFEASFPGLTFPQLDDEIETLFDIQNRGGTTRGGNNGMPLAIAGKMLAVPLARYHGTLITRELAPAELHSQLAMMHLAVAPMEGPRDGARSLERGKAEVKLALAADPGEPVAVALDLTLRNEGDAQDSLAEAERAAREHPGEWQARYLLFQQLSHEELARWQREGKIDPGLVEREKQELDAAAAGAPEEPMLLGDRAGFLAEHGQAAQALPLIQRARRIDPSNPAWALMEAHVLTRLHQAVRATELLAMALGRAPNLATQRFLDWTLLFQSDLELPLGYSPRGPGDTYAERIACVLPAPRNLPKTGTPTVEARVTFAVDESGKPGVPSSESASPELLAAVRDWLPGCRFQPATHEGKPVAGELTRRFVFAGH